MNRDNFLPTTASDLKRLGWKQLDIILVSGDAYIDSPYMGVALIGRLLAHNSYKVGIIAQPDIETDDIARLGEPKLFWGVSSGAVDSMVANHTATLKKRRSDDFTPGGENTKRPDRAVIAYSNLIRQHFKKTVPIVLGGVEASLRRIVHYDFWSNKLRRSILFDAKADILVYGMGEKSILAVANALRQNDPFFDIDGICYISSDIPKGFTELPSYKDCVGDSKQFTQMFHQFYRNNDPVQSTGLVQQHDHRYLIQTPLPILPDTGEMDLFYGLPFSHAVHPDDAAEGKVKAIDTIANSVTTHRGCYGECHFCAIAVHQGTTIVQRSEASVLSEVKRMAEQPKFSGTIRDVGGPTANMFGMECSKKLKSGRCLEKRCLFPEPCNRMPLQHKALIKLLRNIRQIPRVKRVFVASGIRYDMILGDQHHGMEYLEEIVEHHVSGQMKIAPEHSEESVLRMMGKPGSAVLKTFVNRFYELNRKKGKKQFLTYYMIAAHPGCEEKDMSLLKQFASKELQINPEQVQIFTPLPSTYAALMYYTEKDPWTGKRIFVEKNMHRKVKQKEILTDKSRRAVSGNKKFQKKPFKKPYKS